MKLEVIVLDKSAAMPAKELGKISKKLGKFLPKRGLAEVFLIKSQRMQSLNKRFRGKNKSTNVLSFTAPKNFPGNKLGEVYLDLAYIQKHKEDLNLMLVHGVLHILGYDHEKKNDRISMEKKEGQLLSKLAILG
ncbi:MAG: rRNA maturation RNase YbeY [bacterium]|jgi:probable rRNA maturation factor|nr:rRNA maturation RNase YbeY [bacterium]